jgi:hypothetical protein
MRTGLAIEGPNWADVIAADHDCHGMGALWLEGSDPDVAFILAARALVPELVAELEQARSDIANLQRLLRNPETVAMLDAAEQHIEAGDLKARLRAFGRDCVRHGDMTPPAELMLKRILDGER